MSFTEIIEGQLLQNALDCGIKIDEYYGMTIKEVSGVIDSFFRKRDMRRKDNADMIYRLSKLITNGVACVLSKDATPLQFFDVFQDVFPEEKERNNQAQINAQMEINKQHMKEFAEKVNRERAKTGGENI